MSISPDYPLSRHYRPTCEPSPFASPSTPQIVIPDPLAAELGLIPLANSLVPPPGEHPLALQADLSSHGGVLSRHTSSTSTSPPETLDLPGSPKPLLSGTHPLLSRAASASSSSPFEINFAPRGRPLIPEGYILVSRIKLMITVLEQIGSGPESFQISVDSATNRLQVRGPNKKFIEARFAIEDSRNKVPLSSIHSFWVKVKMFSPASHTILDDTTSSTSLTLPASVIKQVKNIQSQEKCSLFLREFFGEVLKFSIGAALTKEIVNVSIQDTVELRKMLHFFKNGYRLPKVGLEIVNLIAEKIQNKEIFLPSLAVASDSEGVRYEGESDEDMQQKTKRLRSQ